MSIHGNRGRWALAAGLALLLALPAAAQAAAGPGTFGFFGGLNIANMGGDMDRLGDELETELENEFGGDWAANKNTNLGLGFGAYYVLPVAPTVGLQFEAQYIRRGTEFEITTAGLSGDAAFNLDYFEVPLLLRIAPGEAGAPVKAFFLVGPVFSFKASADLEVSAGGQSQSGDVGDMFKSTVFGALGGVGVALDLAPTTSLVLQGRYYLGLTNALDDPSDTYSSKSQDLGFFAGVEIGLGN